MLGQNNNDDPLIALALRWNIVGDREAKQNTVTIFCNGCGFVLILTIQVKTIVLCEFSVISGRHVLTQSLKCGPYTAQGLEGSDIYKLFNEQKISLLFGPL